MHAPEGPQPTTPAEITKAGDQFWPLRAFRELDDLLLRLRVDEPEIGTIVIRTEGSPDAVLAVDQTLVAHQSDWLVDEIIHRRYSLDEINEEFDSLERGEDGRGVIVF